MPKKQHEGDAAFDLYVPEDVVLQHGRQIIDLKFSIELPIGYAATIQPRSGFSSKGMIVEAHQKITKVEDVFETTIDADVIRGLVDENYRGNVGAIIKVTDEYCSYHKCVLKKGTRIAQMQIVEVPQIELVETEELSETDRGERGFGHTGVK
jgi:dUTP pyrophosphatase